MRIGSFTLLLALSLVSALLSQSTSAQTAKPLARETSAAATTTPAVAPAVSTKPTAPVACNCPTPVVQRHYPPYSAKQTTTRVQTLGNGTTVTTVTTSQIWRDADGRTHTETVNAPTNGTPHRVISIYDPLERERMSWTVDMPNTPKVVNVFHYPQPVAQPVPVNPQPAQRYYPTSNESLPPQTIDGIYATGFRYTNTTPAGYVGNDRDLTTTRETWTAPSLGITLRSIIDDPRYGKTTTEVTDIQQTAPDPALFQLPEGYQIKETNQ